MPSRKIRPRIFIAAILLAVVSAFGVVVWQIRGDDNNISPTQTVGPTIHDSHMSFYAVNFLVETNPTSTQPLVVHVHGGLSDSCTRLRVGLVHYHAQEIYVSLVMGVRGRSYMLCAGMIYPITVSIPLDVAALAPGEYTLNVMGQTQTISITPEMQAAAVAFDTATTGLDIDAIRYVPVSTIESQPAVQIRGQYTIDCPYIIGVVQQTAGNHITLIPRAASVESALIPDTDCRQNTFNLPEPMPLEIPLDLADLPLGEYTLTVGDQSVKFDLDAAPTPPRIIAGASTTPLTEPPTDPYWLPVN